MKQIEFNEKVAGLVKILQDSDIIQRCMKLSEKGKKDIKQGNDYSQVNYEYFFRSNDETHNLLISTGDVYRWDNKRDINVKYNGIAVLNAIQCELKDVASLGFSSIEEKEGNLNDFAIYAKQSGDNYYKVKFYQRGEWEVLVSQIEKGTVQEYKKQETLWLDSEVNQKYAELLKNNFKI